MKFARCLLLVLFVWTLEDCTGQVPENLKELKQVLCSDDAETVIKLKKCAETLPSEVRTALDECGKEAAPGLDEEKLRQASCDPSQDVGKNIEICMKAKRDSGEKLSPESLSKLLEAINARIN